MQQQSAISVGFARDIDSEVARHEQEVLSTLQWAISHAADAILLKDDAERRRVLIAGSHSAYNRAWQLMTQKPGNDQRTGAAKPCASGSAVKKAIREWLASRQV